MNLNELHWLRFGKIRLQEFCLSYLIITVEGPSNYFVPGPGKPWDGPADKSMFLILFRSLQTMPVL
jgi:hypothetical protein